MSNTMDFRYTIRTKKGKIIAQRIVAFGSKRDPWPEDWVSDGRSQIALDNYKVKMFDAIFDITVEQSSDITDEAINELNADKT